MKLKKKTYFKKINKFLNENNYLLKKLKEVLII